MSAASSEDIIRHIIRDIVSVANIARQRKYNAATQPQQPPTQDASPPSPDKTLPTTPQTESISYPKLPMEQLTSPVKETAPQQSPKDKLQPPYSISETMAAFMVRAVVMDESNKFDITKQMHKEDVDRLIKICARRLVATDDAAMETVKMQVYFDTTFPVQNEYLQKEKNRHDAQAAPVLRDIVEIRSKTVEAIEDLHRKIITYIVIKSNMGVQTDLGVLREVTAALESVFPQSELPAFLSLTRSEKESQLNGLTQLVTGIRLFNRELGKGGDGIVELPVMCREKLNECLNLVQKQTEESELLAKKYNAVIEYMLDQAVDSNNSAYTQDQLNRLKHALIFRRQMILYLDALQEQLFSTKTSLSALSEKLTHGFQDLKTTCRSKSAVPVDQVYPQFMTLATIWSTFQDILFILSLRLGISDTLDYFSQVNLQQTDLPESTLRQAIDVSQSGKHAYWRDLEPENLPDATIITNATRLMTEIALINTEIEVVHPGNTGSSPSLYWRLMIEYGGFCPFTLVSRNGLLQPGNWNHGVLRYRDKLYAFASTDAAMAWSKDPDGYAESVLKVAKGCPDLVQLLHLYQYFPTVDALENAKSIARHKLLAHLPVTSDSSTQTETHILDSYISPTYHWNEWEMRRRALLLVNLRYKATKGIQTNQSHFRKDTDVQTWEKKEGGTQTGVEKGSGMPKKQVFIGGLRGPKRDVTAFEEWKKGEKGKVGVKVVELTLDQ